jgi:hypothetical protein
MLQEPNNEQKLTYIYEMMKDQERASSRAKWYRLVKWMIMAGIAYVVVTHPGEIVGRITEYVKPIVMEQVKSMMSSEKSGLLDEMKALLPTEEVAPAKTAPLVKKPVVKY